MNDDQKIDTAVGLKALFELVPEAKKYERLIRVKLLDGGQFVYNYSKVPTEIAQKIEQAVGQSHRI